MAIEPVLDWTTDYDIFDDEFVRDPYPVWEDLRAGECPVAHTARWGGSWMPTKYDDIVAFAHDVETFTSQQILVVPPISDGTQIPYSDVAAPPITSDPPEHHWARRLILPIFSPQSVAKYEQGARDLCNQLIDGFVDAGRADAAADYAQQIPVRVIADDAGRRTPSAPTSSRRGFAACWRSGSRIRWCASRIA